MSEIKRWMDGWLDGWMTDRQIDTCIHTYIHRWQMTDIDRLVSWKELLTCYSSIIFFPFLLFLFQGGTVYF